jgi:hypothetical protein
MSHQICIISNQIGRTHDSQRRDCFWEVGELQTREHHFPHLSQGRRRIVEAQEPYFFLGMNFPNDRHANGAPAGIHSPGAEGFDAVNDAGDRHLHHVVPGDATIGQTRRDGVR